MENCNPAYSRNQAPDSKGLGGYRRKIEEESGV
jgi:hypothetical protein